MNLTKKGPLYFLRDGHRIARKPGEPEWELVSNERADTVRSFGHDEIVQPLIDEGLVKIIQEGNQKVLHMTR